MAKAQLAAPSEMQSPDREKVFDNIDAATLSISEIGALCCLLNDDQAANAFGRLSIVQQTVIFGALERMARTAYTALFDATEDHHG